MFQLRSAILANFLFLIFLTGVLGFTVRDRRATEEETPTLVPCSRIISVESQGVLNYLATINFRAPIDFVGQWQLEIETAEQFTFFGSWGVATNSDGQSKRANLKSAQEVQLSAGDKMAVRFRISYGRNEAIPYVNVIRWEGRQICGPVPQSV